jgi:hypothetical protein
MLRKMQIVSVGNMLIELIIGEQCRWPISIKDDLDDFTEWFGTNSFIPPPSANIQLIFQNHLCHNAT